MLNGENFFDQPVKNDMRTYDNIREMATGQGDDNTTSFLLDYVYFKNYYKMVAIDLSKQQTLDADPKVIQQANFTGNLNWAGRTTTFFIIEEAKKVISNFSQGTIKALEIYFVLI